MNLSLIIFRKIPLLFIVLLIGLLRADAQTIPAKDHFTISGKINTSDNYRLILEYTDQSGKLIDDTTTAINGKFKFRGLISTPTRGWLTGKLKSNSLSDPNFLTVFLEPADMSVELTIDHFGDAKVSGSLVQQQWEKINFDKRNNRDKLNSLSKRRKFLVQQLEQSTGEATKKLYNDSLAWVQNSIVSAMADNDAKEIAFMFKNPGSFLSPYLLYFFTTNTDRLPLDSAQQIYESFSPLVKNSGFGLEALHNIQLLGKIKLLDKDTARIGYIAPAFSRTDINKNDITLASYIGKNYVLLDFWASWCGSCIQFTPHLKEIYSKYKSKGLKVISISIDRDIALWKQAIAKHNLTGFIHIYDLPAGVKKYDADARLKALSTFYKADTIPTFVLIDEDGKIAAIYNGVMQAGDLPQLDEKLAEVIKN